jgi:hypothetical protein
VGRHTSRPNTNHRPRREKPKPPPKDKTADGQMPSRDPDPYAEARAWFDSGGPARP